MRRIDLTMGGDFSKPPVTISPNGLRVIGGELSVRLPIINSSLIKDSELNSNFLTGDVDSINNRRSSLEFTRSIGGTESMMCDRCGVDLIFNKDTTLCEDCDLALDAEYRGDSIMRMIFR